MAIKLICFARPRESPFYIESISRKPYQNSSKRFEVQQKADLPVDKELAAMVVDRDRRRSSLTTSGSALLA
jgi:hypothetical protein